MKKKKINKYRKKPAVVETVRFENEDLTTLDKIVRFLSDGCFNNFEEYNKSDEKQYLAFNVSPYRGSEYEGVRVTIDTLEGTMDVSIGDYIIKGVDGKFYSCKPEIFEKAYEECKTSV